jgi:hypothetical protein
MVKWIAAAIAIFVLSVAVSAANLHLSRDHAPPPAAVNSALYKEIKREYQPVSLVALLASPERFDGHKVRVSGFITLGFEDLGLHLDKNAYDAGLRSNALWLDRPAWLSSRAARRLNGRYGEIAVRSRPTDVATTTSILEH